jgi:putative oxidoreductase
MLAKWSDHAAIPLRVVLAAIFLFHGAQKLFGLFGAGGPSGTADYLASLGLTPGLFWAVVVGLVEFVGGAALLLGVLTRWVALGLGIEMVVALFWVHLPAGFAAAQGGIEFPLALVGGLASLVLSGAQRYALDEQLPGWVTGTGQREAKASA